MKVIGLHISKAEYHSIVEKTAAMSLSDLLKPIESEFEPGVAVAPERIECLLKKLKRTIRNRLIHILKTKRLIQPISRWKQRADNPNLYRLDDDLDIDNADIPRALVNVDQLIPDLRQKLCLGIEAVVKKKAEHSMDNE